MKRIKKDMIKDFGWKQCSFCKNVIPEEKGLSNRKNKPRINPLSGLCTNCEKIQKGHQ